MSQVHKFFIIKKHSIKGTDIGALVKDLSDVGIAIDLSRSVKKIELPSKTGKTTSSMPLTLTMPVNPESVIKYSLKNEVLEIYLEDGDAGITGFIAYKGFESEAEATQTLNIVKDAITKFYGPFVPNGL